MSGRGREKKSPRSNVCTFTCMYCTYRIFFLKKKKDSEIGYDRRGGKNFVKFMEAGWREGWNEPNLPFFVAYDATAPSRT